ncbi:MAG: MFS transporter [Deltaproteobacteria bacterium]|nr:MFS transporter [Deltaproteobacteria bacterium]
MFDKINRALKAQPHASPIQDPAEIKKTYRHYRIRMMYGMGIGYAVFYFLRKNFSMAMPVFLEDLHYTHAQLGMILSLFSIIYGFGKFFNGILADRANPRYFMALGLLGSAVVNIFFGLSSSLTFLGIFWLCNALFQSMGWPPCARMLTHWYGPKELGTMWGIWNASHQIGGAGILILAGYLIPNYGWRSAFFVPAAIGMLTALFLINRLRDTPQSIGLPPIEEYRGEAHVTDAYEDTALSSREILFKYVLKNKLIWLVSVANFFVYIVRIGVLDWAPTFLVEAKGSSLVGAGVKVAGFEISGILGALAAGWLSDKVFKGRRGPVNVLFMLALIFALFYFWKVPAGRPWMDAVCLIAVGFVVYGPQMLVGVAAADFASKKAAATATGMTGTFGYLGSTACGIGTGLIVQRWGWDGGFVFFIAAAVIGTLCFLATWKHRSAVLEAAHKN